MKDYVTFVSTLKEQDIFVSELPNEVLGMYHQLQGNLSLKENGKNLFSNKFYIFLTLAF